MKEKCNRIIKHDSRVIKLKKKLYINEKLCFRSEICIRRIESMNKYFKCFNGKTIEEYLQKNLKKQKIKKVINNECTEVSTYIIILHEE